MYRDYPPRMGADGHYYDICKRYIQRLRKLESQVEILKKEFPSDFEETSTYFDLISEAEECSSIVIVFAAMCLEAFIYDYGAVHTSDSFMKNYLDKLTPEAKWIIIPKIVTGKDFPRDSQAFEWLRRLIKARNEMVHFKSFDVPIDDERKLQEMANTSPFILAQGAYKTLGLVMTEFQKLDPEFAKTMLFVKDQNGG